uniref:Uncharacterized protein n=1 Tax=Rhizophora mucronata TaxID=61149 RepID=A0A2P2J818_RHIMU
MTKDFSFDIKDPMCHAKKQIKERRKK